MYKNLSVSLVLPCHNEESALAAMLKRIPPEIDEIIVVDNASTDGSAEVAAANGARVVAESRPGYGIAYKTGFAAATGDIIVTMDADDTYPLHAAPDIVAYLADRNLDFITVRRVYLRWERSADFFIRFLGKKIIDAAASLLFLRLIRDTQSGMWVFRRGVLDKMNLTSDVWAFSEEIKLEAFARRDIRAREVPVVYEYRKRLGKSKLKIFRSGFDNFVFLFRKRLGF